MSKVIATIGPRTESKESIRRLSELGVKIFRLNLFMDIIIGTLILLFAILLMSIGVIFNNKPSFVNLLINLLVLLPLVYEIGIFTYILLLNDAIFFAC